MYGLLSTRESLNYIMLLQLYNNTVIYTIQCILYNTITVIQRQWYYTECCNGKCEILVNICQRGVYSHTRDCFGKIAPLSTLPCGETTGQLNSSWLDCLPRAAGETAVTSHSRGWGQETSPVFLRWDGRRRTGGETWLCPPPVRKEGKQEKKEDSRMGWGRSPILSLTREKEVWFSPPLSRARGCVCACLRKGQKTERGME